MPPDERTQRVERFLSLAVGLAAIAAAVASLYQASLARAQLRASAWPFVQQGNTGPFEGHGYTRVVVNQGVGPARVRSVRVLVDGNAMKNWSAAVRALTGQNEPKLIYSSFGRGSVLPAGAQRTILALPPGPIANQFWVGAQDRLRTLTCYCSVYDECWMSDSNADEPSPVEACTVDEAQEFRQ